MRLLLKIFLWLTVGVAVTFALLLIIMPNDVVEHKFPTYEHAVAAGAIEKEWLPYHLPKSATNIHSQRNLDFGGEVVTFNYGPDFDQPLAALKTAPPRPASSFGMRWVRGFDNTDDLTYVPIVPFYREHKPGSLLVNRKKRIALYFD